SMSFTIATYFMMQSRGATVKQFFAPGAGRAHVAWRTAAALRRRAPLVAVAAPAGGGFPTEGLTARAIVATLILFGTALPAPGKLVCPGGRFTIRTSEARLDGLELVLGEGDATLSGRCRPAPARRYLPQVRRWLHLKAHWTRCDGPRLAMRARFDLTVSTYC